MYWIPFAQQLTPVPIHVYAPRHPGPYPLVLPSAGVDTQKIELHRLAVAVARLADAKVIALDMPGTGESSVALTLGADAIYHGVLQQMVRAEGTAND